VSHTHTHTGHAANRSSATPDANIFERLYKEAEERERQHQVKRITAHLVALDLASITTKGARGRSSGVDGGRKSKQGEGAEIEVAGGGEEGRDSGRQSHVSLWEVLYADAQKAKVRKQELEKQQECKAREERKNSQKMNTKSQDLSQKRLRKEVKTILEHMGFLKCSSPVEGGGRDGEVRGGGGEDVDGVIVSFSEFSVALEAVLEKDASMAMALQNESAKRKQALYQSLWSEIMPLRPSEDPQEEEQNTSENGGEAFSGRRLIDLVICASSGENWNMEAKGGSSGKWCAEAMLALANTVSLRRLSDSGKPAHLRESERQSLLHRRKQLKAAAAAAFAKILRELGSNLNDLEITTLFDYFHLATCTLKYLDFSSLAKNILTPRRKAIERVFSKFDAAGDGTVLARDLCLSTRAGALKNNGSKTPRSRTPRAGGTGSSGAGGASTLENIFGKLEDVERRLKELVSIVPGEYKGDGSQEASESEGSRGTRAVTNPGADVDDNRLLSGDMSDNDVSAKHSNSQASAARRPVKTGLVCM
jgi:hypothetical protein